VNAISWAPHSQCHICTAGDDSHALIWDMSSCQGGPVGQVTEGPYHHLSPPTRALPATEPVPIVPMSDNPMSTTSFSEDAQQHSVSCVARGASLGTQLFSRLCASSCALPQHESAHTVDISSPRSPHLRPQILSWRIMPRTSSTISSGRPPSLTGWRSLSSETCKSCGCNLEGCDESTDYRPSQDCKTQVDQCDNGSGHVSLHAVSP
jgi:hypothetical protein